jgi:pantothenate kinase
VRPLLDRAIYVEIPREMVRSRLMKRHAEEGLFGEERNRAHIERVDLPNYDLVVRSRPQADIAISLITES